MRPRPIGRALIATGCGMALLRSAIGMGLALPRPAATPEIFPRLSPVCSRPLRSILARHVARLSPQRLAQPGSESRTVVRKHRAQLCRRISVDRLLSADGEWDTDRRRSESLPRGAGGGRAALLRVLLPGPGDSGDENRVSAVRRREFHVRLDRRLSHAGIADGPAADRMVRGRDVLLGRLHPEGTAYAVGAVDCIIRDRGRAMGMRDGVDRREGYSIRGEGV